jgi:hypothetical protein
MSGKSSPDFMLRRRHPSRGASRQPHGYPDKFQVISTQRTVQEGGILLQYNEVIRR